MTGVSAVDRRTAARRVLVRHLSETPLLTASFGDRIFALLDDLEAAGVLPATVGAVPRPREREPVMVAGWAARVVAARERRRWTPAVLAERAGVAKQTVQKIEADEPVRTAKLAAVRAVLNLTKEP